MAAVKINKPLVTFATVTLVLVAFLVILFGQRRLDAPYVVSDWTTLDVDKASPRQLLDYVRWTNASSCRVTRDFGPGVDGRKTVCMDDRVKPDPGSCLVYSFGYFQDMTVANNMAKYGCRVFVFDPTVQEGDERNGTDRIHIYPLGLHYEKTRSPNNWTLVPLKNIYYHLVAAGQHEPVAIDYVRLDLDDYDLHTLSTFTNSGMVDIIVQLAAVIRIAPEGTTDELRSVIELYQELEHDGGMVRFASNGIPSSDDYIPAIDFEGVLDYEIAYYNSRNARAFVGGIADRVLQRAIGAF